MINNASAEPATPPNFDIINFYWMFVGRRPDRYYMGELHIQMRRWWRRKTRSKCVNIYIEHDVDAQAMPMLSNLNKYCYDKWCREQSIHPNVLLWSGTLDRHRASSIHIVSFCLACMCECTRNKMLEPYLVWGPLIWNAMAVSGLNLVLVASPPKKISFANSK